MSRFPSRVLAVIATASVVLAACGEDGNDVGVSAPAGTPSDPRTIEITMMDIEYEPTVLTVSAGETVRFVFTNAGKLRHEAVAGDAAAQAEHEAEMLEMGDMAMEDSTMDGMDMGDADHEETPSVAVEPGATAEIVMTFDEAGETIIGCHQPGHWKAGMRVDITIAE